MKPLKILSEELVHEGIRLDVYNQEIQLPDGRTATWELMKHNGAAAMIAVDEEDKILVVEQYRNAADAVTLEIPAGVLDTKNEDPYDCARRELEEETGYCSDSVEYLLKIYPSIGTCNEVISVYVAKNLIPSKQNLDEDEYVNVHRYRIDEIIEMIFKGEIVDSKTIAAIFAYKEKYL